MLNPNNKHSKIMANDVDDALLNALTKEEIGELVELIDPDVSQ